MNLAKALQILESVLGKSKKQSNNNYLFFCSLCNHYKPKLTVNLGQGTKKFQQWHCWICEETNQTKGRTLYGLLKKFNATPDQITEMRQAIGERSYNFTLPEESKKVLRLPLEYKPLWKKDNSVGRRHAMLELKRRKIIWGDIVRYHIGYCEKGEYANRIILPSYDENGVLNYFTARSYFKNTALKYKNPDISKNVIVYDMLINWNLPIMLVEGMFDAIAVRRNAIPLLGKTMSDKLFEKIVMNKPPFMYVALDQDAIRDSIKMSEKLTKVGVNIGIIQLGMKDPSDLGFAKMIDSYKNDLILMDESSIFKMKMRYGIR